MENIKSLYKNFILSTRVAWKSSKWLFIVNILCEMYLMVSPIIVSFYFKQSTNALVDIIKGTNASFASFVQYIFIIIVFQAISVIIGLISLDLKEQYEAKMSHYVDNMLVDHINALDISYYDNLQYHNIIDKAKRDSIAICRLFSIVISSVRGFVQIITCGIILLNLNWYVPICVFLATIPVMFFQKKFLDYKIKYKDEKILNDRQLSHTKFILTDKKYAQDIRIFHTKDYFSKLYENLWKSGYDEKLKLTRKKILYFSVTKLLPHITSAIVLIFVGLKICSGILSIGDYTYFNGIISQYIAGFNTLITSVINALETNEQINNFTEFLNTEPNIKYDGKKILTGIEQIEFREVSFKYPGTDDYVLKNINFTINNKDVCALVGRNGAGKTSIVKLLMRLYEPTSGAIYINGVDIKEYDILSYHSIMGIVPQDFNIYMLPLRDNIALECIDEKSNNEKLCVSSQYAEFNYEHAKYVKGFDTYIGRLFDKEGVYLSGGENQRIAIARAFFNNEAKFYVMDEPNSALDPEAEAKVLSKLKELCAEKSALFITHRMSSVSIAKNIIVLDKGEIVERGTQEELLHAQGLYYELYNIQSNVDENNNFQ